MSKSLEEMNQAILTSIQAIAGGVPDAARIGLCRWVKCSERLPPEGSVVSVIFPADKVDRIQYNNGNWISKEPYDIHFAKPAYWLEVIQPPMPEES